MRIVVWNAHEGFRREPKKAVALAGLRPDIAIVPEAGNDREAPDRCSVWKGEGRKGLAVQSFGDYRVTLHPAYDPELRWAVPVSVSGPHAFFLLAIWQMRPYTALWKVLEAYRPLLVAGPAVVAGDFNITSRSMFRMRDGSPAPWGDFGRQKDVEFYLRDLPLLSAYHKHFREAPGAESRKTLYFQYKEDRERLYHMDFCCIPESWAGRLKRVKVGTYRDWVHLPNHTLSDHVPLTVDVALSQSS